MDGGDCVYFTYFFCLNWVVCRYGSENVSDQPECWWRVATPHIKRVKQILECKSYSPEIQFSIILGIRVSIQFFVDIASKELDEGSWLLEQPF